METIIGLFKTECGRTTIFHDGPYRTIADVEHATAGWVDWTTSGGCTVASTTSPQSSTRPPHYAALNPEPQPV